VVTRGKGISPEVSEDVYPHGHCRAGPRPKTILAHIARTAQPHEAPVMEPFLHKEGTAWRVIIRYHEGHERRIEGFASKAEAVDWIEANATQVDE
jgi:hypothetical protein